MATLLLVVLAMGGLSALDRRRGDTAMLENSANIAGAALATALQARDRQATSDLAAAVGALPDVIAAGVYTPDGRLFAAWNRTAATSVVPRTLSDRNPDSSSLTEVFRPVRSNGEVVGTIYVASERENNGSAIPVVLRLAVAAITAVIVAALVALSLKRRIADPITDLAHVAQAVTTNRNYALRATSTSNDEIGSLVARFNDMLTEIEAGHSEVRRHRDRLEEEVMIRTSELGASNALLTAAKTVAEATARANAELSHRDQLILETAAEGIFGLDAGSKVTFFNHAASELLGWTARELVGQHIHPLIHPASQASEVSIEHCPICSPRETHRSTRPVQFRTRSGELIPVEYSSAMIRDDEGRGGGAVVTFRDVRERLAVERMKDEFVSTVSHELRTPLTSIRGALGLLTGGILGGVSPKALRMFEIAVRNTDRLIRLVNDILDVERISSGLVDLRLADIDAGDLMRQAGDVMQGLAERSGVRLEVESVEAAAIRADSDRVLQALTNLLSNAVKFSPLGAIVRLSATRNAAELVFDVTDQGRGIPADKLDLVFERFKQVEAGDAREKGGTGLGLAICRSIANAHGGRIWVTSEVGVGSRFSLALPLAAGQCHDPVHRASTES